MVFNVWCGDGCYYIEAKSGYGDWNLKAKGSTYSEALLNLAVRFEYYENHPSWGRFREEDSPGEGGDRESP